MKVKVPAGPSPEMTDVFRATVSFTESYGVYNEIQNQFKVQD